MLLTNVSASSINDAALALADVIYFNYVSNGDLRIDLSPVGRWLKASAKRVLILSFGPGSAEGITPLLNGPGGGIVLGVDMSRRIIYIGDIDIFSANNSNSGINNSKGTINSNASKLIANLFAWVVGVVQ